MIYIFHNLLNLTTSGINTWCKLFKSNYDDLSINIIDNLNEINFNTKHILIINHLDILVYENIYYSIKIKPILFFVIHNLDYVFIKLLNSKIYLIDYLISIIPLKFVNNKIILSNEKIFYLPNIDLKSRIKQHNNLSLNKILKLPFNQILDIPLNQILDIPLSKQFNYTFYYYGRIDYEKNIILLIDLMQYYFKNYKLIIIYPHNTKQYIFDFYKYYVHFTKMKNVMFVKDINFISDGNDLIYLSAGTMEGMPYTYLELLSKNKIIISYNSGLISELLDEDFMITYNQNYKFTKLLNNVIEPLISAESYVLLHNLSHYNRYYHNYPFIGEHLLLPTYISGKNIHRDKYYEHLNIWVDKINIILNDIELYLEKSNKCYNNWYIKASNIWKDNDIYKILKIKNIIVPNYLIYLYNKITNNNIICKEL